MQETPLKELLYEAGGAIESSRWQELNIESGEEPLVVQSPSKRNKALKWV